MSRRVQSVGAFGRFSRVLAVVAVAVGAAAGAVGSAALADTDSAIPQGDPERGRAAFGRCATCHDVGPRARHKTGPELNGLFGRKLGAVEGYPHSLPMVAAGLSGLYWDDMLLDIYLWNPASIVPMSDKSVIGVADLQTRLDIIAYLKDAGGPPTAPTE